MEKSKLMEANEKIAEGVVGGYKKIEEGVVDGYKKIEEGAVSGFNKIADKFVDNFLTKEGESVEEAKARMAAEQKEKEARKRRGVNNERRHGSPIMFAAKVINLTAVLVSMLSLETAMLIIN